MRVTVKKLVEVLARLDKCENMAQVCYMFDGLPNEIKALIEESRDKIATK